MNLARPGISTLQKRRGRSVHQRQVASTALVLTLTKPSCRKAWRRFGHLPRISRALALLERDIGRTTASAAGHAQGGQHLASEKELPRSNAKLMCKLGEALQLGVPVPCTAVGTTDEARSRPLSQCITQAE